MTPLNGTIIYHLGLLDKRGDAFTSSLANLKEDNEVLYG